MSGLAGNLIVRPIEAVLTKDTEWLGKMNPYVLIVVGETKVTGTPCKDGATHPHWTDILTIPVKNEPTAILELRDKEKLLPDKHVGASVIDLNEIRSVVGPINKWYPIFYKGNPAGEVLVETQWEAAPLIVTTTEVVETVTQVSKEIVTVPEVVHHQQHQVVGGSVATGQQHYQHHTGVIGGNAVPVTGSHLAPVTGQQYQTSGVALPNVGTATYSGGSIQHQNVGVIGGVTTGEHHHHHQHQHVQGGQHVLGGQQVLGGQHVSGGQHISGGQHVSGVQQVLGSQHQHQHVQGGQQILGGQHEHVQGSHQHQGQGQGLVDKAKNLIPPSGQTALTSGVQGNQTYAGEQPGLYQASGYTGHPAQ